MAQNWSFIAVGVVASGANAVVSVPSSPQSGDLLVLVGGSASTFSGNPTGWTNINGTYTRAWYKISNGTETTVTLQNSATNTIGVVLQYRGIAGYDKSTTNSSSSTTISTTSFSATYTDELIISCYGDGTGARTWTAPGSTTTRVNSASTSSLSGLLIVDEYQAASGSTTARTATVSSSTNTSSLAISFYQNQTTTTGNFFLMF